MKNIIEKEDQEEDKKSPKPSDKRGEEAASTGSSTTERSGEQKVNETIEQELRNLRMTSMAEPTKLSNRNVTMNSVENQHSLKIMSQNTLHYAYENTAIITLIRSPYLTTKMIIRDISGISYS
jgi:hypothetical protein